MNRHLKIVASTVVFGSWFALNVASAAPASPGHTIVLDSEALGESNITSYQFGAGLGVSSARGGNRTVSEPSVSEVSITRYVDAASPLFFAALTKGESIGNVEIIDGELSIELMDVIISGYSLSAAVSANPQQNPQSESISLNFTQIVYSVNQGTACYDLKDDKTDC